MKWSCGQMKHAAINAKRHTKSPATPQAGKPQRLGEAALLALRNHREQVQAHVPAAKPRSSSSILLHAPLE
jgi:hypothetical protein